MLVPKIFLYLNENIESRKSDLYYINDQSNNDIILLKINMGQKAFVSKHLLSLFFQQL